MARPQIALFECAEVSGTLTERYLSQGIYDEETDSIICIYEKNIWQF